MKVLVTGAAGFIGMHLAERLERDGADVTGVDNFDPYYDVGLKRARAARLASAGVRCETLDLADASATLALIRDGRFSHVAHLAAQPGVRYSLVNPAAYLRNNIDAFAAVLEGCRQAQIGHLVYASSSSVYGANHTLPFSEDQRVDHPLSLYAATKRAGELIAHSYSHLYRLPATGLRFFTVYGPWGRPDMSPMLFARAILAGEPIRVFNHGKMRRDFTYVDDIVEGVLRVIDQPALADPNWSPLAPRPSSSNAPYRIYNIGNNQPVKLMRYIEVLEQCLGRKAQLDLLPLQAGDVPETVADVSQLAAAVGFRPGTPVETGIARFVEWYRSYYQV